MGQEELDRAAGAALREARKASGVSQETLAADAGVDQSLLSKGERLGPGVVGSHRFCRVAAASGYAVEMRLVPTKPAGVGSEGDG